MKIKILAFLLLTVVTVLSTLSCDGGFDCGPFPEFFKWTDLEGTVYEVVYSRDSNDELVIDDFLTIDEIDGSRIRFNRLAIGLQPRWETYGWQDNSWNLGLINTANACSPGEPRSEEKIDNIIITANKDFNSEYPMGTDLSELFDVLVTDYFNNLYEERIDLKEFVATNPTVPNSTLLLLTEKPAELTTFKFTIKYYQQGIDFDFFEFTTANVVVE